MTIEDVLYKILEELKEIKLNDRCRCCRCGYYRYYPTVIYDPFGTHINTGNITTNNNAEYQ